jgi:hypothetical protein
MVRTEWSVNYCAQWVSELVKRADWDHDAVDQQNVQSRLACEFIGTSGATAVAGNGD